MDIITKATTSFIRFFLTCLLAVPVFAIVPVNAGTVEQTDNAAHVISMHLEAMGGKKNWESVKSLRLSGQFTSFSLTNDFTTIITREGKLYSHYQHGKHPITEGYDGITYWMIDPWQGFDFPRKVNKAEKNVLSQKAETGTPLLHYHKKGYEVVYKGDTLIDGNELVALELTRADKLPETWFLYAKSFLPYKYISQWVDFTVPVPAETFFDDFREVEGIMIPFYMETVYSTRLIITQLEQVDVNPDTSDTIFSMPVIAEIRKIEPLKGEWNLEVEMMTRSGQWRTIDNSSATFGFTPDGRLQGQLAYDVAFPVHATMCLSYNHQLAKYQLSVFSEMFATTDLYTGNFEDATLVLDDLYAMATVETESRTSLTRYTLSMPDNGRFVIERHRSTDKGETWMALERIHFTRP